MYTIYYLSSQNLTSQKNKLLLVEPKAAVINSSLLKRYIQLYPDL